MEHNVYGTQATFWRDVYLTALRAGHPDPAAAADEAFVAFDCRFSEPTIDGAALAGAEPAPLTADELMLQTSEIETVTPSVVVSDPPVQNPSTEGLSAVELKSDDEVLG